METTAQFSTSPRCRALIIMGSPADQAHCEKIAVSCRALGVTPILRISSAHKTTRETLDIVAEYDDGVTPTVIIAVAGRSNGLGPVLAGNFTMPVINCPPLTEDNATYDIWSSLRMPSGLGCSTVLGADEAALCAAKASFISVFGFNGIREGGWDNIPRPQIFPQLSQGRKCWGGCGSDSDGLRRESAAAKTDVLLGHILFECRAMWELCCTRVGFRTRSECHIMNWGR
ncbi:phosphoribosylaminoimidazole carboxylase [Teladorsagia circumcincta]|uniref:Phosphoribosylaminoimidazole carboxylase n=1 Tax=Teladorsagia circumcincta TaxID=45464 RepID=A0A2G9UGV8_TELCI|nr:phosphoribosylaminoimidazole carboxylase [Teladorsagia circumcincta]